MRDSIGISDSSPLKEVAMRNHFEHFDERIDDWWRQSRSHMFIDNCLISRGAVVGVEPIDWFRVFDPTTMDVTFWSLKFNLQQLVDEVDRIHPKLLAIVNVIPPNPWPPTP